MSWGLGWKRPVDSFHLTLGYGEQSTNLRSRQDKAEESERESQKAQEDQEEEGKKRKQLAHLVLPDAADLASECRFRFQFDWSAADDDDQTALKLQSQLMVALPTPRDEVCVRLFLDLEDPDAVRVRVSMGVREKREHLKVLSLSRSIGSGGPPVENLGVLSKLLGPANFADSALANSQQWHALQTLNLANCSLTVLPLELTKLPMLRKLLLDNNKISALPAAIGQLSHLQVLRVDHNMLVSLPAELKQCAALEELSLEHNKLLRLLLDFRAMTKLRLLQLFGNPLEFLPEILPCEALRILSLANVHIKADEDLSNIAIDIETENASYFVQSKHKLSAFFALVFRFSSCQHPLLASALAKIAQDPGNRAEMGKDESAVRQLLSMILSDNRHVVEQACVALSSLATENPIALRLIKADTVESIETVLKFTAPELLTSVLKVIVNLAFSSDVIASKMLTKDILRRLKQLCAHENIEVQRQALLAVGNLAFCRENRQLLVTSESLRDLLFRLSGATDSRISKSAARALAILGENEYLRRATKARSVSKQGLRILAMDGGGMRGLATVQMLRKIEQGTGKRIHEMFDLICGTSTGGMLAIALAIKQFSLDKCEEIYKTLGKVVFAEPIPKDNEAATWREKLDQLYKSSSQNFRVVVHGSKHHADQFERLLRELCADEEGDLLIESAVKGVPKVFVVSSLVSVIPAQPFVFRNYQYPAGTIETAPWTKEGPAVSVSGTPATAAPLTTQVGPKRCAFLGSSKHRIWEAIRASSAAPYYLDDFSIDTNRWQDGAIVANNPALIAIREAQLLWPDTSIACLVSVGCGNVPTKARGKGGWRYLDTGQVLIESACSVERVEEALDTLLPLLPDLQYYRFNPIDERCIMELDETDPAVWLKLEAATQEYIDANIASFHAVCDRLLKLSLEEGARPAAKGWPSKKNDSRPGLGWRRRLLLVEASRSPEMAKPFKHTRTLEGYCARNSIKIEVVSSSGGTLRSAASSFTPLTSPLFSSTPFPFSPDIASQILGRSEVPPLSLDGSKQLHTPPGSPPLGPRQLYGPVATLHEKIRSSPQIGVVHLALHSDQIGLVLSWRTDIFAVAEPGDMGVEFLQKVTTSIRQSFVKSHGSKNVQLPTYTKLEDLVSRHPRFVLDGALHCFMGRMQMLSDGQEVGSYLFRRVLPDAHLTADDVRWMVGAWRDRVVVCTGKYAPIPSLVKAILDAGAKAVIAPIAEPPEVKAAECGGEKADFEIGEEEEEEEDGVEFVHHNEGDWEDSDIDEGSENKMERREVEERGLSAFISCLYDELFKNGVGAESALQSAVDSHPKQAYRCILPAKD
ncbi:hypothetical protein SELMODRAFT_408233 [Selaginella moellendorffii]|uniref:PNPLA domain-containing protein n=1 Tax=Selaginella moellendorffii TaxID=88036 RepID=D8R7M3_SELML|nr:phospholipase A I [Selaginella moellendorffii]EFJ31555.1 hypothetical protein SELMODRAFT_408233 [Selaginella moellendorffii]|eukprot:XP_002966956.1 phospholipase A I [Selaginella moellendorffii]